MAKRSPEMLLVAFFLSKYTNQKDSSKSYPPEELQTPKWNKAYSMFFDSLCGGRTKLVFENSLKNSRDGFDSHIDNSRAGWFNKDGKPSRLSADAALILEQYFNLARKEIWNKISPYLNNHPSKTVSFEDSSKILARKKGKTKANPTKRDEKAGTIVLFQTEKRISLRRAVYKTQGFTCELCGFDFGNTYGDWAKELCDVFYISKPTDLTKASKVATMIVLCANCHKMIILKNSIKTTSHSAK